MDRPRRTIRPFLLPLAGAALLLAAAPALSSPRDDASGSLRVESRPTGAEVWVDGKRIGVAPQRIKGLAAGDHAVRLELLDHQTYEATVRVAAGEEARVEVELALKPATLHVTTYPLNGKIEIDGKTVGKSEWTGQVKPGDHVIIVTLAKHVPGGETITLSPGDERTVEVVLMEGTPVEVPHVGAALVRRSDLRFKWPRDGDAKGKDGAPLILIPEGEFVMGSAGDDEQAYSVEKPQHRVRLKAFYIDRFEVTNGQYRMFIKELKERRRDVHRTCDRSEPAGKNHTPGILGMWGIEWNGSRQPVVEVDWWDAAAYCAWAGRRLPTEAEWEKAARGTDGRPYPWGKDPPGRLPQGNFADISFVQRNPEWTWIVPEYDDGHPWTAPIGSFPLGASPYAVEEMAGNVWEWVHDWFADGYYKESPAEDPRGPESGSHRTLRGGSWNDIAWDLRTTSRLKLLPAFRIRTVGFRCAMDAP